MTEHAESWVKMDLGLMGGMTIVEAPDQITIPLAWLTGDTAKRAEPYVKVEKDVISFLPTDADPVKYKIVGVNFTDKRFIGEKI